MVSLFHYMVVQGDFTTLTDYQGTSPSPVHPHYVQCILLPTAWGNHSPTYPAAAAYSITNNKNNAIPNIMLSVSYKMQFIGQSEHNGIRIRGQTKALHCQHSKQKVRILLSRSVNCKPSWAQFHIRHFFLAPNYTFHTHTFMHYQKVYQIKLLTYFILILLSRPAHHFDVL